MKDREIKTPVQVLSYQVQLKCKECGEGMMLDDSDNIMLASYPPQYKHKCDKCGCIELLTRIYPYIEQKLVTM